MTSQSQPSSAGPGPWHYTRLGLAQLPVITSTAVLHSLHLAHSSPYMDLKPAITFAVLRNIIQSKPIDNTRTMTTSQRASMRHLPTKGRIWIGKYTAPAPVDSSGLKTALARAITAQNHTDLPTPNVTIPDVNPVYAEWTGYRAAADGKTPLPTNLSGKQVYDAMMKEVKCPTTTLYLHGGGYSYMDTATHRSTVKKIAKLTRARALSVRYRLAPEHPFPAALVDALVAYLSLLYPPPGAYHGPVKPEHIVIAGDRYDIVLKLLSHSLTS